MARKRAATASVAAIVAGTAAGTLGLMATPALAEAQLTVSCTADALNGTSFDVPVTVTGTISGGPEYHPGDKVTLDGVSVTATLSQELVDALGAALPGATDIQISGAYHVHVEGVSDGLDTSLGTDDLNLTMNGGALAAGSLGSETRSGTTQFDVGPADASFLAILGGFGATIELSGTVPPGGDVGATDAAPPIEVQCDPADSTTDDQVIIDAVDVTAVPDNGGGTDTGGNNGNGGKDDNNGHQNTGGNNNTGNNTGGSNNTGNNNTGNNNTQGRSNLANTGASNVVPLTATGGALVLLGGGLLLFMRRRRTVVAPAAAAEGTTDVES